MTDSIVREAKAIAIPPGCRDGYATANFWAESNESFDALRDTLKHVEEDEFFLSKGERVRVLRYEDGPFRVSVHAPAEPRR